MSTLPAKIDKIMSLDLAEFHRSLKVLGPDLLLEDGQTDVTIPTNDTEVRVVYEQLEKATLGGLLALPRSRVTLHLEKLNKAQRYAFVTRFDRAFQRGGG